MKILHVNMSMDSVKGGGTVERVIQIHKALLKLGIGSHILTIDNAENDYEKPLANDITSIRCINKRWYIPYPDMAAVKKVVEEADVIHLMNHWTLLNAWVYVLARNLGKPYIICPAGALTIFGRSTVIKRLYQLIIGKKILQNASATIAISPLEIDVFKTHGISSQNIYHIPNGVNSDDFSYNDPALFRKTLDIGAVPYILFVGRINAIKGPDLLMRAVAELQSMLPHHLIFAGPDGGMVAQLKEELKKLNFINRVHFTGYLGGEMKSSAYHGADLLAVSSRHEAMSIVALEAAISSTPVLLTDQCGFSSLAENGAAIEVPATINGLSNGLKKMLIDNCDLKEMGSRGRRFALENYSWSIMAKRFCELCESIE